MERQSLDPTRQEQAKRYARTTHRLLLVQLIFSAAFWFVLLLCGLSEELRELWHLPALAAVAVQVLVLMVGYSAMLAPLTFYRGFVLPRRYGLLHQSLKSWLFDLAKAGMLSLVLGLGFIVVIYRLLEDFPATWWVFVALLAILITLFMTMLVPIIVIPLFFKLKPLEDRNLAERLLNLTQRAGVKIKGISVINLSAKTSAGNAMLAGLGRTRGVILGDTVLDRYTADEIEVVTAHELGQHRHHDISRLFVVQCVLVVVGFYFTNLALHLAATRLSFDSISDIAAFPVFILILGGVGLIADPLTNAYSRHLETAADEYALSLTNNPVAFVDMMTKLTNQNLSDATPAPWAEVLFYDHPPYSKRVASAKHRIAQRDSA
jgi:STE24 endopeptidase